MFTASASTPLDALPLTTAFPVAELVPLTPFYYEDYALGTLCVIGIALLLFILRLLVLRRTWVIAPWVNRTAGIGFVVWLVWTGLVIDERSFRMKAELHGSPAIGALDEEAALVLDSLQRSVLNRLSEPGAPETRAAFDSLVLQQIAGLGHAWKSRYLFFEQGTKVLLFKGTDLKGYVWCFVTKGRYTGRRVVAAYEAIAFRKRERKKDHRPPVYYDDDFFMPPPPPPPPLDPPVSALP